MRQVPLTHKKQIMPNKQHLLAVLLIALAAIGVVAGPTQADKRKAAYIFAEAENQRLQDRHDAFFELTRRAYELDPTNTVVSYYLGYGILSRGGVTKEEYQHALELMRQHVDAYPGDYYENLLYSDACMGVGQNQESLRVLTRLAQSNHKAEVIFRLAAVRGGLGQWREAIAAYDSLELSQGKNAYISARKVGAYQMLQDTVGALAEMRSLLATAPTNADYNIAMGTMLQNFGHNDSALHYLDLAQQLEPDNGNTYMAKAQYYNQLGDSAAYDEQIYRALTSQDLDLETKVGVMGDYAGRQFQAGDSSQRVPQLFGVLLEQYPHEPDLRHLYSQYLAARTQYKEAASQLDLITDLDATDLDLWRRVVVLNVLGKDYAAATAAAERAIAANPDSLELYTYIGPLYYEMKDYDRALATYDRALALTDSATLPVRSQLLGGKADVFVAQKDTAQAFALYEQALDANPADVSVKNNYAYALAVAGVQLAKAERLSADAVKAYPDNATFLDTYAWVYFKMKDYTMAQFYIESALRNFDGDDAALLDHYGDILWMQGEGTKAQEQWEQAHLLEPENTVIARKAAEGVYYPEE